MSWLTWFPEKQSTNLVWKLEVRFTEKVREEGEGLLGEEEEEEEIGQKV